MPTFSMQCTALAVSALAVISSSAAAQISVGPAGSGANYQQVQAALAAAPVGATIFVLPGEYEPFEVTQGVSIVGSGRDLTGIAVLAGSNDGAIDVSQVPVGQTVRISGLSILTDAGSPDARIAIDNCLGRVELVDVHSLAIAPGTASFVNEAVLLVEDCANVMLDGCRLHGSRPPTQSPWMQAGKAMRVDSSTVYINACELKGYAGWDGNGGDALVMTNSYAEISRSELEGGDGGAHFGFYWWDIYGYQGQEAIELTGSEVVIAGGPGSRIEGGQGAIVSSTDWSGGGPAVLMVNGSTLRYASDATLMAGSNGDGSVNTVFVQQFGTGNQVFAESEPRATLTCEPAGAMPGDIVAVRTSGEANGLHFTFAAFTGITPLAVGSGMRLHIDPAVSGLLALIPLDASGNGILPVPLPASTALAGASLILQSIDSDLSDVHLSNSAMITVLVP